MNSNTEIENFADLFQQQLSQADIRPGMTVKGTIVSIDHNRVIMNVGLKSDVVIPVGEFQNKGIEVDQLIDVIINSLDDGLGNVRASRDQALRNESWHALEEAFNNNQSITGLVTEKVKGGYTVNIDSVRGFLPGSLVDPKSNRDNLSLEGKEFDFQIIKLDRKRNNVVVSRRAVVDNESTQEQREQLLKSLQENQEVTGIVKNITDYGAFIDLGGVDGLLHITDMAWKRVKHPTEILALGNTITVRILNFDREKNRVSLGLKQMGPDPWQAIAKRYPPKTRLIGRVTNIMDYGCFVEIEHGIEGLVHVSEMDWTNRNIHPTKVIKLNDEVEVMVLEIDEARRRISLGIKQCLTNPWAEFSKIHNKGDEVSGLIKSITDFGLFIGLEGGIDGLVHLSDLSWTEPGENLIRDYKKGDQVKAIILAIDADRERISLGIKQLETDPYTNFIEKNPKGTKISGTISAVDNKRIVLELGNDLQGHIRTATEGGNFSVGDTIEAYMIGLDRKANIFNLSLKATEESGASKESTVKTKKELPKETPKETIANTTLGDLLREQIEGKEDN